MSTLCSLVTAVCLLPGQAAAQVTAPSTRDPEAAKMLFDLPEATPEEYAQVEGQWQLAQDTGQTATQRRIKTHRDGKTTVTTYDDAGKIVSKHSSEYKLKRSGLVRIFVYSNVVPATGPSQGHTIPGPFYYAVNVQDNRFLEVYGLLAGDDRSPRVLCWDRTKE